ncbi:hypothetical protein JCM10213_004686 [Rhodosporidiobolus nylandii]
MRTISFLGHVDAVWAGTHLWVGLLDNKPLLLRTPPTSFGRAGTRAKDQLIAPPGPISLLFVYSLDYARTRLAADNKSAKKGGSGERQFNGLLDVYKKTIASDGVAGLYRGFLPSVVGIVVYRGLYFGMYDSLKPVVMTGSLQGSFLASFLLGWGVTTGAGIASYPLDTIRRRMMMTSGEKVHYNGMLDAGRQIVKAEGVASLFKGAGANILRGVAGAGVLSMYDKLQELVFGKVYSGGSG